MSSDEHARTNPSRAHIAAQRDWGLSGEQTCIVVKTKKLTNKQTNKQTNSGRFCLCGLNWPRKFKLTAHIS